MGLQEHLQDQGRAAATEVGNPSAREGLVQKASLDRELEWEAALR
jgi:hypothetical protein